MNKAWMSCSFQVVLILYPVLLLLFLQPFCAKELDVDLCDLNFINVEDERTAHLEFINVTNGDNIRQHSFHHEDQESNSIEYGFQRQPRIKRQASGQFPVRTIETAIFVDSHLKQRFEGRLSDLKRLVLSIMHEVQLIYMYQSMKIPIKIVIVKLEILDRPESSPNNAGGDIDRYLDNFCSWQARRHRSTNSDDKWDHALMLTGLDLYKDSNGKRNKKVLGLAWVNGMCKPTYSCTLNEGKSFEAAFVIAHEMAHSLGILHDGKGNNCDPDKYLMSEKTGPGKVNWSPCSNKYLENFLSRGNGRCLDNDVQPAPDLDFTAVSRLPGEQYNTDLQCQLALGTQYKAYHSQKEPFNDVCRELWCLSGSWATPAHPALEGSTCGGNGEKCFQGSCSLTRGLRAVTRKPSIVGHGRFSSPNGFMNRRGINRNPAEKQLTRPNSRLRVTLGFGFPPRRRGLHETLQERSSSSSQQLNTSHLVSSPQKQSHKLLRKHDEEVEDKSEKTDEVSASFGEEIKSIWNSIVSRVNYFLSRITK